MKRDISNFTLILLFRDWGIWTSLIVALGIGGSIVGHVGSTKWPLSYTLLLMCVFSLVAITVKSISFAFREFVKRDRRLQAVRMITGEGFSKGRNIIVFEPVEGFTVGQLITLCCSSSGATQSLVVLEITAANESEIQAACIVVSQQKDLRKYFEEESRRKMLFATSSVTAQNLAASNPGVSNEQ